MIAWPRSALPLNVRGHAASSTKDYFFEVQQEACIEWGRQTYGFEIDPDEEPDLWGKLATEYSEMLEERAEIQWLNRHSHQEFFIEFEAELAAAASLLAAATQTPYANTVFKLVYAHTVTLMEALVSSVVRKLVESDENLLMSLAAGYKKVNVVSVTLKDIAEQPKVVETIVLKILADQTFHNASTIKEVFGVIFGEHMKDLNLAGVGRICSKRHDIVHRNGKTVDDQPIELSPAEVDQAINTVSEFTLDVRCRIDAALREDDPRTFLTRSPLLRLHAPSTRLGDSKLKAFTVEGGKSIFAAVERVRPVIDLLAHFFVVSAMARVLKGLIPRYKITI